MQNEAISKLVLTETERNLAEQLVDSYDCGGTVNEICRKALALSKAVGNAAVTYRCTFAPSAFREFTTLEKAKEWGDPNDKYTQLIIIELPIEGGAQ